jgi:hypothetical protein
MQEMAVRSHRIKIAQRGGEMIPAPLVDAQEDAYRRLSENSKLRDFALQLLSLLFGIENIQ